MMIYSDLFPIEAMKYIMIDIFRSLQAYIKKLYYKTSYPE